MNKFLFFDPILIYFLFEVSILILLSVIISRLSEIHHYVLCQIRTLDTELINIFLIFRIYKILNINSVFLS